MSCTILKDKLVKIKKQRRCFGCCRQFEIGSFMQYQAQVFDGDFNQTYHCQTCEKYLTYFSNLFNDGDGYCCGWMLDEMNGSKQTVEEFSYSRQIAGKTQSEVSRD